MSDKREIKGLIHKRFGDGLETEVTDGTDVTILPAVAGG